MAAVQATHQPSTPVHLSVMRYAKRILRPLFLLILSLAMDRVIFPSIVTHLDLLIITVKILKCLTWVLIFTIIAIR